MFVFKAMIKIDIMNSWFPFFFFHKSTYFWGRMKKCVHPGCAWFHLSFSLFSICSNFNQSRKSLQFTGSMSGLTASLKIFKVLLYIGLTKRRCIMGWPSAWSWVWGVWRTVRKSRAFIEKKMFSQLWNELSLIKKSGIFLLLKLATNFFSCKFRMVARLNYAIWLAHPK